MVNCKHCCIKRYASLYDYGKKDKSLATMSVLESEWTLLMRHCEVNVLNGDTSRSWNGVNRRDALSLKILEDT